MFETHIRKRRSMTPFLLLGAAVVTAILLFIPWPYTITTSYTLEPVAVLEAQAPREGTLAEVPVKVGQAVKRGDVVARYDIAQAEEEVTRLTEQVSTLEARAEAAGLTAAQAALQAAPEEERARAQAAVDRILRRRGVAELEAELVGAREALARARSQVEAATIVAPGDGVVGAISAKEGEALAAQQRVVRIDDVSRLKAVVAVPAGEPVASGQQVTLNLPAGAQQQARIDGAPENGLATAVIDNPSGSLQPGETGTAIIDAGQRSILLGHQGHASR